jgi:hypothetical protein
MPFLSTKQDVEFTKVVQYPHPRMTRTSACQTQARTSMSRRALNRSQQSNACASIQNRNSSDLTTLSNTRFCTADYRRDDFDESHTRVLGSSISAMSAEMLT